MSWPEPITLRGTHATLVPLSEQHHDDLVEAVKDGELWKLWYTVVPEPTQMRAEIQRRLALQGKGAMLPFAVINNKLAKAVGMTSYGNVDQANRHVEIGWTWYRQTLQRTELNSDCKMLLLTHAFEVLNCICVEFRTHFFNHRSRGGIERLGAKFDGVLRNHQIASLLSAFDRGRKFLESRYGPLPFRDYRIAEMPNDAVPLYGASEEGFIISRSEMMVSEEGLLGNLVHELAHSWWGNKVLPQGPGGYLLNEGMASFSGMEFFESVFGRERTIHENAFGSATGSPDATIYGCIQLWRAGKDAPISELKSSNGDHYNIAQTKGVWFLRMLRDRLGEGRFYSRLRTLIANEPNLSLATFRKAMLDAAPNDQGLQAFLAQWLDQTGIPVLDVRWRNTVKGEKTRATLSIFQSCGRALRSEAFCAEADFGCDRSSPEAVWF